LRERPRVRLGERERESWESGEAPIGAGARAGEPRKIRPLGGTDFWWVSWIIASEPRRPERFPWKPIEPTKPESETRDPCV
jgi:hypothetical protein